MASRPGRPADHVGLCVSCAHVKVIESSKGSAFYLCRLAETDPRFRRYPVLPVRRCDGYGRGSLPDEVDDLARGE